MHVHILRSNEPQNELDIQKNCSVWNKNIAKHKLAYKLHTFIYLFIFKAYTVDLAWIEQDKTYSQRTN